MRRSAPAEVSRQALSLVVLDVRDEDAAPFLDEQPHGGLADAARTTCDDRDLTIECPHTNSSPCPIHGVHQY